MMNDVLVGLPGLPGITGGHPLRTPTPDAKPTEEQRIRGGDAQADWILLVCEYDASAMKEVISTRINESALVAAGTLGSHVTCFHILSYAMTPNDLQGSAPGPP
jgi:hypothetical protein